MTKKLKCKMPECDGVLGKKTFPIQTGCNSCSPCVACIKCGRVHSIDGYLMYGRAGHSPFLRKDGVEMVLEPIQLTPDMTYKTIGWMWVEINGEEEELQEGAMLIFDGMDEETFCFHDIDGIKYRLHRGDVNFIEAVN